MQNQIFSEGIGSKFNIVCFHRFREIWINVNKIEEFEEGLIIRKV
ncbi:hypothetical protein PVOR_15394 [Paenibacillus vortex V453]|uniref:Uncharacterized protein n=1 Tax=Paenibacillus vortex V453 TaxID=715225 RepID=A0A2R9SUI6_9BACL|nr:hypothetical protein PVOR_15394 [Paenibacillus vortex V453]